MEDGAGPVLGGQSPMRLPRRGDAIGEDHDSTAYVVDKLRCRLGQRGGEHARRPASRGLVYRVQACRLAGQLAPAEWMAGVEALA